MKFRPDIEGLRALAIVPVVVFHAWPSAMPGGFVGGDIFFVVSGCLITTLLLQRLAAGRIALFCAADDRNLKATAGQHCDVCDGWLSQPLLRRQPPEHAWRGQGRACGASTGRCVGGGSMKFLARRLLS